MQAFTKQHTEYMYRHAATSPPITCQLFLASERLGSAFDHFFRIDRSSLCNFIAYITNREDGYTIEQTVRIPQ